MYLARIRRTRASEPELVARIARSGDGNGFDLLLPLASLVGAERVDPVEVAVSMDMFALKAEVTSLMEDDDMWESQLLNAGDVLFDPPTPTCTKICCLALNYREHAAESNVDVPPEPVLFFKPPSSLIGHRGTICAPIRTRHLEHEVELGVVIGTQTRDLPVEHWLEAVAGYTVINDITARDLQLVNIERNVPWDQSKSFDTFAPVGPYLATVDEVLDPQNLSMTLSVGGQIRQKASTSQMVYPIPQLIANLSDGMTLMPGDIIATGTTAGIAPLKDDDVMTATIGSVGSLVNPVRYEAYAKS